MVALLLSFVTRFLLDWQDVDANDQTFSYKVPGDCRFQPTVVTGDATVQALNISAIYSQIWSRAEKRAKEPAHSYMKRCHAVALFAYTDMLRPRERHPVVVRKLRFDSRSFFLDLGEAIQMIKHSQVMCLHTTLPAEALHNLNASGELLRFRTFTMGRGEKSISRNSLCILIRTCFGADVSYYSANRWHGQVLIPPYEVFKVTREVPRNSEHQCQVVHRLEGQMDCVYNADIDSLQSIHTTPSDTFWLLFIILCMIIAPLALPLLIVKLLIYRESSCCSERGDGPSSAKRQLGGLEKSSSPLQ